MMSDIDGGMRYVIDLPLQPIAVPTEPRVAESHPARPHAPMLARLTVMCIDDHADALEALELMLRTEDATVLPFRQGSQALAWLEQHPVERWPHLLVCDISLGEEEDGHAVMRHIRQLEVQRGVPLDGRMPAIALTGHARPEDRLRALMAGFQMHLVKPVDGPVLTETLATLAGLPPNENKAGITKAANTGESIAPAPWVKNKPREGRK
jgi:ATP-binding cassette, subfamily B, bacterial